LFSDADDTNPESWDTKPKNGELKLLKIRKKSKKSKERHAVMSNFEKD
jgi:hypothetical protein